MLKNLAIVLLSLICGVVSACQQTEAMYGKTEEQVLAMGHDAWTSFHTRKAGASVVAQGLGEAFYRDALAKRNNLELSKISRTRRDVLFNMRAMAYQIVQEMMPVAVVYGSGRATFDFAIPQIQGEIEDCVDRILRDAGPSGMEKYYDQRAEYSSTPDGWFKGLIEKCEAIRLGLNEPTASNVSESKKAKAHKGLDNAKALVAKMYKATSGLSTSERKRAAFIATICLGTHQRCIAR